MPGDLVLLVQGEGEVLLRLQLQTQSAYSKAPKYFPRVRASHGSRKILGGGWHLGDVQAQTAGRATSPPAANNHKAWPGEPNTPNPQTC